MLQQNKGCRCAAGRVRWPACLETHRSGAKCRNHKVAGAHPHTPAAPLRCVLLCMLRSSGNPAVHCRDRQVDDVAVDLLKRHCMARGRAREGAPEGEGIGRQALLRAAATPLPNLLLLLRMEATQSRHHGKHCPTSQLLPTKASAAHPGKRASAHQTHRVSCRACAAASQHPPRPPHLAAHLQQEAEARVAEILSRHSARVAQAPSGH